MLTSLCAGRYPRIVSREGRICRRFWGLVVSTCGMAHCLRVIRSAVVTRHDGIVDGKRRRTHCPYQQRRGGKHGHYSLYPTQHTLLTLFFPSRVFTHAGAGMVRCEKAGTPRRIPLPDVLGRPYPRLRRSVLSEVGLPIHGVLRSSLRRWLGLGVSSSRGGQQH